MRIEALLDDVAFAAIEAAVVEAERGTSGEIVPVLVERSDPYAEVRVGAAALVAFAAGGLALFAHPALWAWLVPTQIGVFLASSWLLGRAALLHRVVPDAVQAERVARAAALVFQDEGLVETRDRTGILIYVSLLERRVVVLADRGIHSRVDAGIWDDVVARVVSGIKAERAEEGIAEGIRVCGEILAERFPARADDIDELSNEPRGG